MKTVKFLIPIWFIIICSIADLYLTLIFYFHFIFEEYNPIALVFLNLGPTHLIVFKLFTLIIAVAGLWHAKKTHIRTVAVVSWVMVLVFTILMFIWSAYAKEVQETIESSPAIKS